MSDWVSTNELRWVNRGANYYLTGDLNSVAYCLEKGDTYRQKKGGCVLQQKWMRITAYPYYEECDWRDVPVVKAERNGMTFDDAFNKLSRVVASKVAGGAITEEEGELVMDAAQEQTSIDDVIAVLEEQGWTAMLAEVFGLDY